MFWDISYKRYKKQSQTLNPKPYVVIPKPKDSFVPLRVPIVQTFETFTLACDPRRDQEPAAVYHLRIGAGQAKQFF